MSAGERGPDLVLPAAVLRVWGDEALMQRLAQETEGDAALRLLAAGQVAVLPGPGRPGVLDRALALGRLLVEPPVAPRAHPGPSHALMALERVRVGAHVERMDGEVFALFDAAAPALQPFLVHATAHAVRGFERSCQARPEGKLGLRSGRVLPIFSMGALDSQAPPWRNREVLGRELRWVPRPELERELASGIRSQKLLRVVGPLGVGKTRLAATVLKSCGIEARWHDAQLGAIQLRALARELRAAAEVRWLVVDSLESAGNELWNELVDLSRRIDFSRLRWLLIGREPIPWPKELAAAATVTLPGLDPELGAAVAKQLFTGLSLPEPVAERLLDETAGNPFALEEGLVSMARERRLRQVLGSFFYAAGTDPTEFHPTPRFALHVESELERLGSPSAARALATIAVPIPATELAAAASASGAGPVGAGWELPYLGAGMFAERSGPWGEGLGWSTPALGVTVAATLEPASRKALAAHLGAALTTRGGSAAQRWSAYPLLAGTPTGARTLLAATAFAGASREELLAALLLELRAARNAKPRDPALELDLIWALLPLGRRLGRLHELREMIDRAVLLAEDRDPDRLLALAAVQAELDRNAGKLAQAEEHLKRALAAARGSDERRQVPLLLELARLLAQLGRPDEARGLLTKTLAAAERKRRTGLAASCRFQLGNLALAAGKLDEARALHDQALEARRRMELPSAIIQSLAALGAVAFHEGNYPQALARDLEALEFARARQLDREESYAQLGVGRVLSRLGDDLAAANALRRALALREGRDDRLGEAVARLAVANNHLRLERVDLASKEGRRAFFDLSLLPAAEIRADAEQLLARIALRQRHLAEAAAHLSEAERLHRAAGDGEGALTDLGLVLEIALAREKADDVIRAFDALTTERDRIAHVVSDDLIQFALFRGARWLAARQVRTLEPLPFLHRAYHELLRKTAFLEPSMRQRFLFQIPEHSAIVDAATIERIPMPAI